MPPRECVRATTIRLAQTQPGWDALADDLQRRQLVRRIRQGIRQSDAGETMTEAEAKAHPSRWL